ncbi:MAG: hypothetical protein AAB515_01055 [Patescibacteria group bacterium]
MHLSDEDIAKLGALGRLHLSPEQRHAYAEQLSRIVAYTERLNQAGSSVPTTAANRIPLPANHLREDMVRPVDADVVTAQASKREGRFIVSPPIA